MKKQNKQQLINHTVVERTKEPFECSCCVGEVTLSTNANDTHVDVIKRILYKGKPTFEHTIRVSKKALQKLMDRR